MELIFQKFLSQEKNKLNLLFSVFNFLLIYLIIDFIIIKSGGREYEKNIIYFIINRGVLFLTVCNLNQKEVAEGVKFKEKYESFNDKQNDYFEYRNLSMDEQNTMVYSTADEVVQKIENKETFIAYFGDPECPWCCV